MRCRQCGSWNTRVTCTTKELEYTKRYCRCHDCGTKYRTVERYEVAKPIPVNPFRWEGATNPNSKLTRNQILEIRVLHQQGLSNGQIALKYKQNRSTICKIVNYKTYKDIV